LTLQEIARLVNAGTLAVFIIVSAGLLLLRYTRPEIPRPFRCPLVPFVPLACIGSCTYLIWVLPTVTPLRFVIWLVVGLAVYLRYGMKHSRIAGGGVNRGVS
jgi:APA family basic amino acid/polyamine antiporter